MRNRSRGFDFCTQCAPCRRLLQNSVAKLTARSDPVIDPINIIKDLGFPCVTLLFRLSRGKDSHNATSILSSFPSAGSAPGEEHRNCEIHHAYLQCLSEYICSAERAITSAQVLRELVRRSKNTVQSLRLEYENDIEHLQNHRQQYGITSRLMLIKRWPSFYRVSMSCLSAHRI